MSDQPKAHPQPINDHNDPAKEGGKKPNSDNGHTGHPEISDRPIAADINKLLQPLFDQTPRSAKNAFALKEEKIPGNFPNTTVGIVSGIELTKVIDDFRKQVDRLSLNESTAILHSLDEHIKQLYSKQYSDWLQSQRGNGSSSPAESPQKVDVLQMRRAQEQSRLSQQPDLTKPFQVPSGADVFRIGHLQNADKKLGLTEPHESEPHLSRLQVAQIARDIVAAHNYSLYTEYKQNDWLPDSKWYGVDNQKFLRDIQSKNLYNVSDYDKFRALAVIDNIKEQNQDVFKQDINKLTPDQRQLRELIEGKADPKTSEHKSGLEENVRTSLVTRLQHEATKLDIAIVNQQTKQGLLGNSADAVIGHIGKSGGWGGMVMDSDATSQAANKSLEGARQATQNLLALSEFKGNNLEFTKAYLARVKELEQSLEQTSENLNKMCSAHQGRVEGISDIVQVAAALGATLACASAAPETFGGSLAAIPAVAAMAAGAAGKVTAKMLESETRGNGGKPYTGIFQDVVIAAITSAPFLPGNKIAEPLLAAEATIATRVATAEAKPLMQRMLQGGSNLAARIGELTPRTAAELTVKYSTKVGEKATVYAFAGGMDGATIQGSRALVNREDPWQAIAQGFLGGAMLGPVMGPAIKYGATLAKRGMDWLKTKAPASKTGNDLLAAYGIKPISGGAPRYRVVKLDDEELKMLPEALATKYNLSVNQAKYAQARGNVKQKTPAEEVILKPEEFDMTPIDLAKRHGITAQTAKAAQERGSFKRFEPSEKNKVDLTDEQKLMSVADLAISAGISRSTAENAKKNGYYKRSKIAEENKVYLTPEQKAMSAIELAHAAGITFRTAQMAKKNDYYIVRHVPEESKVYLTPEQKAMSAAQLAKDAGITLSTAKRAKKNDWYKLHEVSDKYKIYLTPEQKEMSAAQLAKDAGIGVETAARAKNNHYYIRKDLSEQNTIILTDEQKLMSAEQLAKDIGVDIRTARNARKHGRYKVQEISEDYKVRLTDAQKAMSHVDLAKDAGITREAAKSARTNGFYMVKDIPEENKVYLTDAQKAMSAADLAKDAGIDIATAQRASKHHYYTVKDIPEENRVSLTDKQKGMLHTDLAKDAGIDLTTAQRALKHGYYTVRDIQESNKVYLTEEQKEMSHLQLAKDAGIKPETAQNALKRHWYLMRDIPEENRVYLTDEQKAMSSANLAQALRIHPDTAERVLTHGFYRAALKANRNAQLPAESIR